MQQSQDSSDRKKILVFPCGSEIGLEVHRALAASTHVEVHGASSIASTHGPYVFANYHEGLPYVDDPGFIEELNALVHKVGIDFIVPAHDSVVLKLAEHESELACGVVGSPAGTCAVCRNKRRTYETFVDKLRTPAVFDVWNEKQLLPVFVKPAVGQGSKGAHVAHTKEELAFYLSQKAGLLALEYLPGAEYTIDCFTDRHGALRFAGARERIRTVNGISVDTRPVDSPALQEMAEIINRTLTFRGVWFFQAKETAEGEAVLLEIAPRVSGGMGLYRNLGVNFVLLSIFDRMGSDVHVAANPIGLRMDRALYNRFRLDLDYEHLYIDLDDTLVVQGQVNVLAAALLHQCRNRGVKVHVLSRHRGDIGETLRRYGIEGLVDSIHLLGETKCKSTCMKESGAVFVDDSFAERKRVHEATGIPTFAVDAIESLLDWRC